MTALDSLNNKYRTDSLMDVMKKRSQARDNLLNAKAGQAMANTPGFYGNPRTGMMTSRQPTAYESEAFNNRNRNRAIYGDRWNVNGGIGRPGIERDKIAGENTRAAQKNYAETLSELARRQTMTPKERADIKLREAEHELRKQGLWNREYDWFDGQPVGQTAGQTPVLGGGPLGGAPSPVLSNMGRERYHGAGPVSPAMPAAGAQQQAVESMPAVPPKRQAGNSVIGDASRTARDMFYEAPAQAIGKENLSALVLTLFDMFGRAPAQATGRGFQAVGRGLQSGLDNVATGSEWLSNQVLGGVRR